MKKIHFQLQRRPPEMSNVSKSTQVSLLSLILPKESLNVVSNAVNSAGATGIFQVTARGSVLSEGGLLNRFFPPPAPEQLLLQALVPNGRVKEVTEAAIKAGHLDRVGSGAVFTIDCNDAFFFNHSPVLILMIKMTPWKLVQAIWKPFAAFAKRGLRMILLVLRSKVEHPARPLPLARVGE